MRKPVRLALLLILICALAALTGCGAKRIESTRVLLDGEVFSGGTLSPDSQDDLRVYITYDGGALIDLPFGEAHTVSVIQPDGSENAVTITGEAVFMESANCDNQDCVHMGSVTRDNLEMRVMGGFIICLPHKISVEVRGK